MYLERLVVERETEIECYGLAQELEAAFHVVFDALEANYRSLMMVIHVLCKRFTYPLVGVFYSP